MRLLLAGFGPLERAYSSTTTPELELELEQAAVAAQDQ